uniref:Uncharacterized protein n=1 Tax=Pipistrellus kuhlii TaxID=59472 RepID=A0A7J8B1R8_PIPKU|nr:hypothetical protein mPipKuh1_007676 [Pipistrellus kuhlii]
MAPHPRPSTAPKALEIHQHPQLPPPPTPGQAGGQIPPPSASSGAERWGRPPMAGWLRYTQNGRGSGHAWAPFRPLTSKILPPDRYRPPTTENRCCSCNNVRVKIARPTLPRAAPRLLPWPIRYGSCFHPPPAPESSSGSLHTCGSESHCPPDHLVGAERGTPLRTLSRVLSTPQLPTAHWSFLQPAPRLAPGGLR